MAALRITHPFGAFAVLKISAMNSRGIVCLLVESTG